jgi:hypothetical protein
MRLQLFIGAPVLAGSVLLAACGGMDHSATTGSSASNSTANITTATDMAGMDHGTGSMTDMTDGAPAEGLKLSVPTTSFTSGKAADLTFRVLMADGTAVTAYEVEQTKELHLILVRMDLTGYQHIHPTRAADGTWSIPVTFINGGDYRMVADFVPVIDGTATGRTSITSDLTVTGSATDTALPAPSTTATVDGYAVKLNGTLSSKTESAMAFTITTASGAVTTLEPYLGAYGHLVAFANSDLAYTHVHPDSAGQAGGMIDFVGKVTAPGLHRLFLQFAAGGQVHTAEFTADAT